MCIMINFNSTHIAWVIHDMNIMTSFENVPISQHHHQCFIEYTLWTLSKMCITQPTLMDCTLWTLLTICITTFVMDHTLWTPSTTVDTPHIMESGRNVHHNQLWYTTHYRHCRKCAPPHTLIECTLWTLLKMCTTTHFDRPHIMDNVKHVPHNPLCLNNT